METVLITGASSGIGKELAREFAKRGHEVILTARNEEALRELEEELIQKYGIRADHIAVDLSADQRKVYDLCKERGHKISVLVNNAGFGDYGAFASGDIEKYLNMIDLNNKALVALTYLFVQDMIVQGHGRIINTGSVASLIPGPYMAVYYATKAFVMSFSMALREELRGQNIKVSVLCPAPTKSAFWTRANGETTAVYDNVFARTPKDAARTGYSLYANDRPYAIDGLSYKLLINIARHLPLELCARAVGYIQAKTKRKN